MHPGARSLNVAQAACMVLGEALRQTRWDIHERWKSKKQKAADWFRELRDQICAEFEKIEQELKAITPLPRFVTHAVEPRRWGRR